MNDQLHPTKYVFALWLLLLTFAANGAVASDANSSKPSPDQTIKLLKNGNQRFVTGHSNHPHTDKSRFYQAGTENQGNHAYATVITCSDSRVPVERVFDAGIMDIFVIRVAGNVCDTDEIGSIEYGLAHVNTPVLVVLGHTQCGAVTAVTNAVQGNGHKLERNIPALVDNIQPAVERTIQANPHLQGSELIEAGVEENVWQSIQDLFRESPSTRMLVKSGKVKVVGAIYDVGTGNVRWLPESATDQILAKVEADPTKAMNIYADAGGRSQGGHGNSHGAAAPSQGGHGSNQVHAQPVTPIPANRLSELDHARHREIETASFELTDDTTSQRDWLLWGLALGMGAVGFGFWKFSSHLRVGTRLYLGFALMVVLTVTTALGGLYFLKQIDHQTHLAMTGLDLNIMANEMSTLQYEFVLVGVEDQERGEHLIKEHKQAVEGITADLASLHGYGLGEAQINAVRVAEHEVEKYSNTFHKLVEMYHGIEEIKEVLDEEGQEVDHQLAELLHEHQSDLARLEEGGAPLSEIILQTQLVEMLADAELLMMKISRTEVAFLLDKHVDRVTTAEQELGDLIAVLASIRKMIPKAARDANEERSDLALLDKLDQELRDYQKQFAKAIEDELVVEADLIICTEELKNIKAVCTALAKRAEDDASRIKAQAMSILIILILASAVLGVIVSFITVRSLIKPIGLIVERAKEVAAGDLTGKDLPVRSRDEIGQMTGSINEMSHSLSEMVTKVGGVTREVASAATQIAASSEEMSQGMNEQTQQVTQISSAIEEMSASVLEVARKSGEAVNNASESGELAQTGGQVVEQTIEVMRGISEAVTAGAASVQELGKRGEQIGQIIEVINDIADQTNLLALNAAIEAARAGEHGRGFAVVADEVRALADRTTKATQEIAESIKAIQTETGEAVQRMNTGTKQVATGVQSATEAGESLKMIVTSAQEVASVIQSIAAATEQQSAASEQVSRNVESVTAVSRQAGEGANQAASAAAQLSTKAEQLQQLVDTFKTRDQASSGQANRDHHLREAAKVFQNAA